MMRLTEFVPLMAALPVQYQAFRSKRETWRRFDENVAIAPAINAIFGGNKDVLISRADLRDYAGAEDLVPFVMATIIWGYPGGMRGNHTQNISLRMEDLVARLGQARLNSVENWTEHYSGLDIEGLGLSTYTKFLHFLDVQVNELTALILDDRLIKVAERWLFAELEPLRGLRAHNAGQRYFNYLECMHQVAGNLEVQPAALELFLFTFGSNLKPTAAQQGAAPERSYRRAR